MNTQNTMSYTLYLFEQFIHTTLEGGGAKRVHAASAHGPEISYCKGLLHVTTYVKCCINIYYTLSLSSSMWDSLHSPSYNMVQVGVEYVQ